MSPELSPEHRLTVIMILMKKSTVVKQPMLREAFQEVLQNAYREIDSELYFENTKNASWLV